jgi:hypothetical protein
MRIADGGGAPELLVTVRDGEVARDPQLLPDRETILYTLATSTGTDLEDRASVVVESLKSHQRTVLIDNAGNARYVAPDHLVYAVGGVLFAARFDWRGQMVYGERVRVIEGVRRANPAVGGTLHFDVSNNGTAAFLPGPATTALSPQFGLALGDRNGSLDPLNKLPPNSYQSPRVSPDGKRVAFHSDRDKESAIFVYDLSGTSAPLQITFGGRNRFPVWSPDSQRIAFQSDRDGAPGIFWQSADGAGTPRRLTRADQGTEQVPESWSPNGAVLLFSAKKGSKLTAWMISLTDGMTALYGGIESVLPINATFSPDGHWVAYTTAKSTQSSSAVFVQPFPATATNQRFQISRDDDGHHPVWSPGGDEVTYIPGPGRFSAVTVRTQPTFMPEFPRSITRASFLFQGRTNERNHDILPDGRFIGVVVASGSGQAATSTRPEVHVVLNWIEELKQRVPVR